MSRLLGYARVSTVGQSLESQIERLTQAGCAAIYQEKFSGERDDRPQLQACLSAITPGDTLVVTKLDRLARSTYHLCGIASYLKSEGAHLRVLDQPIETETPVGRLTFQILGALAEFENALRKERTLEGLGLARRNGIQLGRRRAMTPQQAEGLRLQKDEQGLTLTQLEQLYRLNRATVCRYLKQARKAYQAQQSASPA